MGEVVLFSFTMIILTLNLIKTLYIGGDTMNTLELIQDIKLERQERHIYMMMGMDSKVLEAEFRIHRHIEQLRRAGYADTKENN